MRNTITWTVVFFLALLFSAGIWLVHAFAAWSMTGVGNLAGQVPPWTPEALPAWLALWIPPEWSAMAQAGAAAFWPWLEAALSFLPSLAQWLTPLAWVVWGLGVLVLVAGGALVHVLSSLARRTVAP